MMAPPKRLFREQRAARPRVRDIWHMDPGDDRRFGELMRLLGPEAHREIDRMPEEAGMLLLLIFFARYRGWEKARIDGKVIDLAGGPDGWWRVVPGNLPESLRRAWECLP